MAAVRTVSVPRARPAEAAPQKHPPQSLWPQAKLAEKPGAESLIYTKTLANVSLGKMVQPLAIKLGWGTHGAENVITCHLKILERKNRIV